MAETTSVQQLQELMRSNRMFALLDVRERGSLPGAQARLWQECHNMPRADRWTFGWYRRFATDACGRSAGLHGGLQGDALPGPVRRIPYSVDSSGRLPRLYRGQGMGKAFDAQD